MHGTSQDWARSNPSPAEVLLLARSATRRAAALAIGVMGGVSALLYVAPLPTVWHLTLVIAAAAVLVTYVLVSGLGEINAQIHISANYSVGSLSRLLASLHDEKPKSPTFEHLADN